MRISIKVGKEFSMGAIDNLVYGIQKKTVAIWLLGSKGEVKEELKAQFNPSEYTISRGLSLSRAKALGRNTDPTLAQAPNEPSAILNITLNFDAISELHSLFGANSLKGDALKDIALGSFYNVNKFIPKDVSKKMAGLTVFDADEHSPNKLRIMWGTLDFIGRVESSSVSYTMFSPNGSALRSSVKLSVVGEEAYIINRKKLPQNSPDRTKERTLGMKDQLWMHADKEYSDPSKWRDIAEANGILNPRNLSMLTIKIPPIL